MIEITIIRCIRQRPPKFSFLIKFFVPLSKMDNFFVMLLSAVIVLVLLCKSLVDSNLKSFSSWLRGGGFNAVEDGGV